jgi:hypothetical protein
MSTPASLPMGLRKSIEFGIHNIILEMDTNCPVWNAVQLTTGSNEVMFCHIDRMITDARASLGGEKSAIFINLRDMVPAWDDITGRCARARMLHVVEHLSMQPAAKRIAGILFEEPSGDYFT